MSWYRAKRGGKWMHASRYDSNVMVQVEFLRPMTACILSERRATRPFGLCGGKAALPGKNYLIRRENGVDRQISLGGKVTLELQAGDKIRIETPGATFPRRQPVSLYLL